VKEDIRRFGRDLRQWSVPNGNKYISTRVKYPYNVLTRLTSTRRRACPLDGMTTMAGITAPQLHRVSLASAALKTYLRCSLGKVGVVAGIVRV
jgi:hypothetical protein